MFSTVQRGVLAACDWFFFFVELCRHEWDKQLVIVLQCVSLSGKKG